MAEYDVSKVIKNWDIYNLSSWNEETDEEKYIKSTDSWKIDFCKSKGTLHSSSSTNYTMVWYWYAAICVSSPWDNYNAGSISLNWVTIWYARTKIYASASVFVFLKPGDNIVTSAYNNAYYTTNIYDYY